MLFHHLPLALPVPFVCVFVCVFACLFVSVAGSLLALALCWFVCVLRCVGALVSLCLCVALLRFCHHRCRCDAKSVFVRVAALLQCAGGAHTLAITPSVDCSFCFTACAFAVLGLGLAPGDQTKTGGLGNGLFVWWCG